MLFVGELDVQTEGSFCACALIACLHDPRTAPSDNHVAVIDSVASEVESRGVGWFLAFDASGAKGGNLADMAIRREKLIGFEHFIDRSDHDVIIVLRQIRLGHEGTHGNQGLQIPRIKLGRNLCRILLNLTVQRGITRGEHFWLRLRLFPTCKVVSV